jgi:CelD/BcsL family acetyltransferase involved in cellulose biosynthesis
VEISTVSRYEEFLPLRGEWNDLVRRSGTRCPYLLHEFVDAWWKGFAEGAEMRFLLARENGTLAGALPLLVSRRTLARLPARALHLPAVNVGFCDLPIADPAALEPLVEGALAAGRFDFLLLRGIPEGSEVDRALRSILGRRDMPFDAEETGEIWLDASGGLEAFRKGRGAKFWSNVRNRTKRIEKAGAVSWERHRGAAFSPDVLKAIFETSLRSWKGEAGSAVGLLPPFQRCFERLRENGAAEAWLLRLDGRCVAYRFGFLQGPVFLELDIAYDKEVSALSPGTLLAARSNEELIAEGIAEINLGLPFPWKDEWSPERRRLVEFFAFRPSGIYPRLLRLARSLKRRREARKAPPS